MAYRNQMESLLKRNFLLISLLLGLSFFVWGVSSDDKSHPSMASLDAKNCTTCHDDITSKKVIHPVVTESGCDSCHEMKKKDKKTLVGLAEEGNDLCFTCHSEIEEYTTKKFSHEAVEGGCETCHEYHSSDHQGLLVSGMEELCSNCHETGEEEFKKKHGRQPVGRLGCSLCHNSHGSDQEKLLTGTFKHVPFVEGECNACHKRARGTKIRLRGLGATLCYACHSDTETEFAQKSIHTPIKKGDCSGCHDPHMSNNKAMLIEKDNKLCLTCHEKIANLLKSKNVHPPAEESCLECHLPHASKNAFQLKEEVVKLCLECHDAEDESFTAKHYNQKPQNLKCTECHNAHASGAEKLANTHQHPPFAEKECDSCHENTAKDSKIKLAAESVNELCLTCHDDKAMDDSKKEKIKHEAIESDGCTACHSAHASSQKYLLLGHTSRVCLSCHDDREEERQKYAFIHQVIDIIGCEACHDPHCIENEKLLVEKSNKLCLACHLKERGKKPSDKEVTLLGKIKIKESQLNSFKKIILNSDLTCGHPQLNHIVKGNVTPKTLKNKRLKGMTFSGEMNCLSCHDAHCGSNPKLFSDGITGKFQLCRKCHNK
jgi:predicted CXXCH cytochrome family protein